MHTRPSYSKLLTTILDDRQFAQNLAEKLNECDRDPLAFFEEHKTNHFHNRGITKGGNPDQTLCYLLDILGERQLVYELDWKADSEELNYALRLLSSGKVSDELFTEDDEDDADGMYELLDMAEDLLEDYGYGLVMFPLDSDSHPIALVPIARREEVQAMIDELF